MYSVIIEPLREEISLWQGKTLSGKKNKTTWIESEKRVAFDNESHDSLRRRLEMYGLIYIRRFSKNRNFGVMRYGKDKIS